MGLANLVNRTYYLCIEDRYAGTVMQYWIYNYKEMPLSIRDAGKGIEGSFVLAIRDVDGKYLSFIDKIATKTRAKIEVR